ncbi:MAG: hypothetical protein ACTSU3_01335 [Candidatus Thorarchaeota archaeon]
MSKGRKQREKDDRDSVVDKLLSEMGVDDELKKDLIESGRIASDVVKVASAEQVRRHLEIEKSTYRLRDSQNLVERNIMQIDDSIDSIERELVPVVLSFLVGLKGNLVGLKTTVIGRSTRSAKTNLQSSYVKTEVSKIFDEEFGKIEDTLTSEMSAPILEKVRQVTDGFKSILQLAIEELTTFKARIADYTQRTNTELEFLAKELSVKPKIEIPKETESELKRLTREVEKLTRDFQLESQKLQNRESEIEAIQQNLAVTKERNITLEETMDKMRGAPSADTDTVVELRQGIKTLEATKSIVEERLEETETMLATADASISDYREQLHKKELEYNDLEGKVSRLENEIEQSKERNQEMDELRGRIRTLESGDTMREYERTRTELERTTANLERLNGEFEQIKTTLSQTEHKLQSYLSVLSSSEKTKAFLMIESNEQMSLREIGNALGASPATVRKWAEDFERLGIARIVDDSKVEYVDADSRA